MRRLVGESRTWHWPCSPPHLVHGHLIVWVKSWRSVRVRTIWALHHGQFDPIWENDIQNRCANLYIRDIELYVIVYADSILRVHEYTPGRKCSPRMYSRNQSKSLTHPPERMKSNIGIRCKGVHGHLLRSYRKEIKDRG